MLMISTIIELVMVASVLYEVGNYIDKLGE